jgi:tripartite-type tricarboxylate transporter receptor subunit TctC
MAGERRSLIVPFPPGGSTDLTARLLAEELSRVIGEQIAVVTEAGDAGIDAMRMLMRESPDRTFMVGNINTNSILPVVQRQRFDFDYARTVAPISRLAEFPSVMITQSSFPGDGLGGFLEHLKETTGRMRYGTDFLGTYVDFDAIMLGKAAGLAVAYRATSGALGILADLETGRTDLAMLNVATATANQGRYKPFAVTGPQRLRNFPDVPTMAEAGFDGIGTSNWQGLFASSKTPKLVLKAMHQAVVTAMTSPTARKALEAIDARAATSGSPVDFAREIDAETRKWEAALPDILGLQQVTSEA